MSRETPAPDMALDEATLARLERATDEGVVWTCRTSDLDVNLVAWQPGHGVASHRNDACDLLLVVLRGSGTIEVDGRRWDAGPGRVLVIPRGSHRSLRATSRFVYLTSHRQQPGTFDPRALLGPGHGAESD